MNETTKSYDWPTPMMYRVTALLCAFVAGIGYRDPMCVFFLGAALLQLVKSDRKEQRS